jgi:hypothetical protein
MRIFSLPACWAALLAGAAMAAAQTKAYTWTDVDCRQSRIAVWSGLKCRATNVVTTEYRGVPPVDGLWLGKRRLLRPHVLVGGPETPAVLPPTLVMANRNDACELTPVGKAEPFVAWTGGRATLHWIGGSGSGRDPCGPSSAHGFSGADKEVVDGIVRFVIR